MTGACRFSDVAPFPSPGAAGGARGIASAAAAERFAQAHDANDFTDDILVEWKDRG